MELLVKFDLFSTGFRKTRTACLALLIFSVLCIQALAQSGESSLEREGAQISLLSAPTMASALLGDSIVLEQHELLAFVSIALDEGWKTYWRLPGRFGLAPLLDWSRSENVASVTTLYPMPSLFDEGDGISIGYSGAVLWPVQVQPIDPKEPVFVHLTIEMGLCEEICFPVSGDLSTRLSPSAGELASMADIVTLAGSLPPEEVMVPAGAFGQSGQRLMLTLEPSTPLDSFAVAENLEGKHSLLRLDNSGALSGPWRHEAAPSHITIISPDVGMQVFRLGT